MATSSLSPLSRQSSREEDEAHPFAAPEALETETCLDDLRERDDRPLPMKMAVFDNIHR